MTVYRPTLCVGDGVLTYYMCRGRCTDLLYESGTVYRPTICVGDGVQTYYMSLGRCTDLLCVSGTDYTAVGRTSHRVVIQYVTDTETSQHLTAYVTGNWV